MSARLACRLGRRGCQPDVAEDILQEVAVRVLRSDVEFTSADDLLPWATAVARRLCIDRYRVESHLVLDSVPEPIAAEPPTSRVVEGRLALEAVVSAFQRLSLDDQRLIASGIEGENGLTPSDNRTHVRRHRARARLAAIVAETWAAVVGTVEGLRRRREISTSIVGATQLAACVVLVMGVALLAPLADRSREAPARRVAAPTGLRVGPDPYAHRAHRAEGAQTGHALTPRPRRSGIGPSLPVPADVTITDPGGQRRRAGVWEGDGDDPLICLNGIPVLGTRCVDQPKLRDFREA